jgi:predicted Rdx family selenoprotein
MTASVAWDPAAWTALKKCLPGARQPALGGALDREEVHGLLTRIEADVRRDVRGAFAWDDEGSAGMAARLVAGGRSYRAGRFVTRSIRDLESRVRRQTTVTATAAGRLSFSVLLGEHALTDIGTLQAAAGPGTLFQVASQFNCLEAPGPSIVPVAGYVHDNTQGPRASVSAFPGTFLRHYAAPASDGTRFTQDDTTQLSLLADAVPPEVATVRGGYLMARMVGDAAALERALETGFEKIRVGVHDDVEVVLGNNWGGPVDPDAPTIAQVFTSTMALGFYDGGGKAGEAFTRSCEWLLRAAYLGTLLAALDLRKRSVILTLVGGGVFGNAIRTIWNAIIWSVDRIATFAPADLDVVLNARNLDTSLSREEIAAAAQARRGTVVQLPCAE